MKRNSLHLGTDRETAVVRLAIMSHCVTGDGTGIIVGGRGKIGRSAPLVPVVGDGAATVARVIIGVPKHVLGGVPVVYPKREKS